MTLILTRFMGRNTLFKRAVRANDQISKTAMFEQR